MISYVKVYPRPGAVAHTIILTTQAAEMGVGWWWFKTILGKS
jgi:hypothetical protein